LFSLSTQSACFGSDNRLQSSDFVGDSCKTDSFKSANFVDNNCKTDSFKSADLCGVNCKPTSEQSAVCLSENCTLPASSCGSMASYPPNHDQHIEAVSEISSDQKEGMLLYLQILIRL
jgi:hypothetical protein